MKVTGALGEMWACDVNRADERGRKTERGAQNRIDEKIGENNKILSFYFSYTLYRAVNSVHLVFAFKMLVQLRKKLSLKKTQI